MSDVRTPKLSQLTRAKFRVKIKSLAAEAVMIRTEERKARNDCHRGALTQHRRGIRRSEQRHTLLARAYLLGRPYGQVESLGSKPIDLDKVLRIVKSLGWNDLSSVDCMAFINAKTQPLKDAIVAWAK